MSDTAIVDAPTDQDKFAAQYDIVDPGANDDALLASAVESDANAGDNTLTPALSQREREHQDTSAEQEPGEEQPAAGDESSAEFPAELLARAQEFNFDPADFGSAKGLERAVLAMDRRLAAFGQSEAEQGTVPQQRQEQPQDDFAVTLKKLEEGYDPEIVQAFKAMHGELDSIRSHQAQQQQARYAEALHAEFAAFDTLVDSFDEQTFGRGTHKDLKGEALKNRVDLYQASSAYAEGRRRAGLPVPPLQELVARVYRAEFGDNIEKTAVRKVADKLRKANGQFITQPTHKRNDVLPHGTERAVATVAAKMRELGMDENGDWGAEGF